MCRIANEVGCAVACSIAVSINIVLHLPIGILNVLLNASPMSIVSIHSQITGFVVSEVPSATVRLKRSPPDLIL